MSSDLSNDEPVLRAGAQATFVADYTCHGYTVQDPFRRDPMWGRQRLDCPAAQCHGLSDEQIVAVANARTPEGYVLSKVELHHGDGTTRVLYQKQATVARRRLTHGLSKSTHLGKLSNVGTQQRSDTTGSERTLDRMAASWQS